jgi:DNA-binding beta-propeller fold protein YncE
MRHFICILILSTFVALSHAADIEVVVGLKNPVEDAKGKVPPGKLHNPFGVDFEADGSMIIVEYKPTNRILRFKPSGELTVIGGGTSGYSGDGGPATKAAFRDLHNVAIDNDGHMYFSDHINHTVRKLDAKTGIISSFAGNGTKGFAGDGKTVDTARFNEAYCVSFDKAKENLYVTDLKNRRIRKINMASGIITTVAGNGQKGIPTDGAKATEAPLFEPRAAALDDNGNLYIVARGGHALRVVTDGTVHTLAGNGKKGTTDGKGAKVRFHGPKHVACDPAGNVYIADDVNDLIRKYDPKTGLVSTVLGKGDVKLNRPHGVTVYKGWLYVADSYNHRILRLKLD